MFWLFSRGIFGKVTALISLLITLLILFWLWGAINPAGLFYQIVFMIVLLVFGIVLFISILFLLTVVKLLFFMLLLRRKIKKSMRKLFDVLER
jgi:hypothetical protein